MPVDPLILASASPRRRDLLAQLGLNFQIAAADIDETPQLREAPRDYVLRMAREKADALAELGSSLLLTADTTVVLDELSLGKPEDAAQDAPGVDADAHVELHVRLLHHRSAREDKLSMLELHEGLTREAAGFKVRKWNQRKGEMR